MPTKKKATKRSRVKKPANKKPPVKASAATHIEPSIEPIPAKNRSWWGQWALPLILGALVLAVFWVLALAGKGPRADKSESSTAEPGLLHVVSGDEDGTGSNQAAGALQPQPTGLQQTQSGTQSTGGPNLQAQTTPDQTTIR